MHPRLLLLALGLAFLSPNPSATGAVDPATLFDNPVVAKGKGLEVRQLEVDESVAALKATLATQNQAIPSRDEPFLRARMLERMILTRLLLQRATEDDKAKAKELADKFIADTKSKAPSEESYRRQLLATGLKPEAFEARALEQAIVEKVIDREIKSKLTVSDAEVRDFYEHGIDFHAKEVEAAVKKLEAAGNRDTAFYRDGTNRLAEIKRVNLARLQRPEQAKADLILIYTVDPINRAPLPEDQILAKFKLATNTVARLKAGGDFATVAREVSEDPDVAKTGGEYTASNRTPMAAELQEVLFRLPLNQVSDPIPTRFGFYIVRVRERIPTGKVPLDEVAKDLRDVLLGQAVEKCLPDFTAELRKEYEVEVVEPKT